MPIVNTGVVSHTLMSIQIHLQTMTSQAVFVTALDGNVLNSTVMEVNNEELGGLLGGIPEAGKTRAEDIADVVYAMALARGLFTGTIE